jgi:hypothetical protein
LPDTLISNLLLHVTRIETWNQDSPGVHGYATGFFLRYEWDKGTKATEFLVTNRHVVSGWTHGGFYLHRGTKLQPNLHPALWIAPEEWPKCWSFHPDPDVDVAIMNMAKAVGWFKENATDTLYGSLGPGQYPTAEALGYLDSLEEVLILGFPIGILDSTNLLPITRRGTTATPPTVDVDGEGAFLVDAPIFPGSSGSPVLLAQEGGVARIGKETKVGVSRLILLGMVSKMYVHRPRHAAALVEIPLVADLPAEPYIPLDLAYVIKTRRIIEAVEAFMKRRGDLP